MVLKPYIPKLEIVVACSNLRGIGLAGSLPWTLKGDMSFFKKVTMNASRGAKNVVVMGKNTYFSIPEKFRPLKDRINIVLSTTLQREQLPESVILLSSFSEVTSKLSEICEGIDRIFIIGGASLYQKALESELLYRVYLTRVYTETDCDVFLPDVKLPNFTRVYSDEFPQGIQCEDGLKYEFQLYQKCRKLAFDYSIVVAVSSSLGIGKDGRLPWPTLQHDLDFYLKLTSEVKNSGSKMVNVRAWKTHISACQAERDRTNVIDLVIASTPDRVPDYNPELVVKSLEEAEEYCMNSQVPVEHLFVMGGYGIYKAALSVPECLKLHLTEVHREFDCDAFFPEEYKHVFKLVKTIGKYESHGIDYQISEYERKTYEDAFKL